jgi:hypothetical protein
MSGILFFLVNVHSVVDLRTPSTLRDEENPFEREDRYEDLPPVRSYIPTHILVLSK